MLPLATLARVLDTGFLTLQLLLVMGVPLYFNTLTHSVFEVNKLTWLRVGVTLLGLLWFVQHFLRAGQALSAEHTKPPGVKSKHKDKEKSAEVVSVKPVVWRRSLLLGLAGLWLLVNSISTVFSVAPTLAWLGTFEYWDGLWTMVYHMAFLLLFAYGSTRVQSWLTILFAMLVTAVLVAMYGMLQSMGIDFMSWSGDATHRVFATVGNPVHLCAYMGMMVPVAAGLLLWSAQRPAARFWGWPLLFFVATGLLYCAQVLSYSRATWLAFYVAMIFFFSYAATRPRSDNQVLQAADSLLLAVATGSYLLLHLFHVQAHHLGLGLALAGMILLCGLAMFWLSRDVWVLLTRVLIISAMAELHFVALDPRHFVAYLVLGTAWFWVLRKRSAMSGRVWGWLVALFLMFALLVLLPFASRLWAGLTDSALDHDALFTRSRENIETKIQSLGTVAEDGNPRLSMWKSALVWWLDGPRNFLVGTGPGTVRYVFPKYRRVEYTRLEQSHIATPDKVHNDYLDILVTRGLLGLLAYLALLGYMVGCMHLALARYREHPFAFVLTGMWCGVLVYLGQIFFNFGMTTTLTVFYALLGLGMAVYLRPEGLIQSRESVLSSKVHFRFQDVPRGFVYGLPLVVLLAVLSLWQSLRQFRADCQYRQGREWYALALQQNQISYFQQASDHVSRAVAGLPWETYYRNELGKIYQDWFYASKDEGEKRILVEKAVTAFEGILKLRPAHAWSMIFLANLNTIRAGYVSNDAERTRLFEETQGYIDRAVQSDPQHFVVLSTAASYKLRTGRLEQALEYYQRAIAVDPNVRELWERVADIHRARGETALAEQALAEIQRRLKAYVDRANVQLQGGDPVDATLALSQAIEFDPNQNELRFQYAQIAYHSTASQGKQRARELLQEVLRRDPNHVQARQWFAEIERERTQASSLFQISP